MKDGTTADECRDIAAQYHTLAEQAADPVRKSEFEVLARKWLRLANKISVVPAIRSNVIRFIRPKRLKAKLRAD